MRQEHTLHKALLLVGTSTLWKNVELSAIADHKKDDIAVELLSYYQPHHSAVEDQYTAYDNLMLKWRDLVRAFTVLRQGGKNHQSFIDELAQNEVYFKGGPALAMRRTYVMGDDTTVAIPKALWEAMLPTLETLVAAESLKASKCIIEEEPNVDYMSVADIGPITGAMGQTKFWAVLREKALSVGYKEHDSVRIYHQVSCAVKCLSDPEGAPPTILTAHTAFQIYAPNGLSGAVPVSVLIPTTENFVCLPSNPTQSITDKYASFLFKHSTRKKIYDQFVKLVEENEKKIEAANKIITFQPAAKNLCTRAKRRHAKKLIIVQPTVDTTYRPLKIGDYKIKTRAFLHDLKNGITEDFINATAMKFAAIDKTNTVPTHADAYIFAPFDPKNEMERAYNYLMLRNALVARALDRCHYKAPIIIMNLNGCYDDAIASHIAYANEGYNKSFELSPVHQHLGKSEKIVHAPTVTHTALSYADILTGTSDYYMTMAVQEVLDFRLKDYHRITAPTQESVCGGTPNPSPIFSVSGYASASSDCLEDHRNGRIIGQICAKLQISLKTGGGDQHSMWSFIAGYNAHRIKGKSHLTCVSTHDIVQVETAEGRLPLCDYWELHQDIGPRAMTLAQSNLHISIGGGDGTGQETGLNNLLLRLKQLYPDQYADREIMYIGKNPAMYAEIINNISKEKFDALRTNPYALADEGIYLFDDADAARPAIQACKDKFDVRRKDKKPDITQKLVA